MSKDLVDFKDFIEKLSEIEVEKMELPKFYIPNWPEEAEMTIELGKREYKRPRESKDTRFCVLVEGKRRISVEIDSGGNIGFTIHYFNHSRSFWSGAANKLSRLNALFLFHQFKEELFSVIMEKLKKDVKKHNRVIEEAKKAFEPFVPFLVVEKLSS